MQVIAIEGSTQSRTVALKALSVAKLSQKMIYMMGNNFYICVCDINDNHFCSIVRIRRGFQ